MQSIHSNLETTCFTEFKNGTCIIVGLKLRGRGHLKHPTSYLQNSTINKKFDKYRDDLDKPKSALLAIFGQNRLDY